MKVLYGTSNPAKFASMKRITDSLGIDIISLKDLKMPIPAVDESGKSPLENAKIKARAYYDAFHMPVFSCDSGLYFDDLPQELQPETHIRRVGGRVLSDDEMTEYYAALAEKYGNKLIGRYKNAICFIVDGETEFCGFDDSLATEPFMLVSKPHEKRVEGFPLDCLSIDIASGKYYYDIEDRSVDKSAIDQGFKAFFEKALGSMEL